MRLDVTANQTMLATVATCVTAIGTLANAIIDPRDVFLEGLELPRGLEREIAMDGDHRYELNGDDSRSLATVGAFRVVAERDLRDLRDESGDRREPDLRHLRDEGLVRSVALDGRERALTLTGRGHHLLEAHRRDRDGTRASRPSTPA